MTILLPEKANLGYISDLPMLNCPHTWNGVECKTTYNIEAKSLRASDS